MSLSAIRKISLAALAACGAVVASPSSAQEAAGTTPAILEAINADIEAYCTNIVDEARDRRYLIQQEKLDTLKAEIEERMVALEDRRAEYEDWLKRRNDFLEKAKSGLVEIYRGMRADAAAERLELVGPEIAAAIVMQLDPRMAAEILNEMDREMAATLTGVIASASDPTTSRAASGNRS